jgi:predicted ATP-grasp superfamily ATP-dependent carboligase
LQVLVHEYCSGGGAVAGIDAAEAAALKAQGRAMRDAMVADVAALPGHEVQVAASLDDWTARVREADAVWSVAPETGGVLRAIAASVPPAKWLGCTPAAIGVAASKRATLRRLAAAGIDTPLRADDAMSVDNGRRAGGRFVVKPDDGAGASDTWRFDSLADALTHATDGSAVEPWIDGDALSLTLLCADGRAQLLSLNRQRVAVGADGRISVDGVDSAIEPADGPRGRQLQSLASRVADALPGLHGLVGIDLVWHAQRGPVVIELNPRVTTAYVGLSAKLERNLAGDLLALRRDG